MDRPACLLVRRRHAVACALAALLACALPGSAAAAGNAPPAPATVETPLLDPWVPPQARRLPAQPPTTGAALRAQVERKLQRAFDGADVDRTGQITRAQASAAGLGYVARHFDAIDRNRTGAVSFDDVKRYLRSRGAKLD